MTATAEPEARVEPLGAAGEASRQLAAGDAEAALQTLTPFLEANQANLAPRFMLSLVAWYLGRLDWSVQLARECHQAAPMDGAIAETLASLYAQIGDLRESLYMGKLATALGSASELRALVPAGFPSFDRAFLTIQESPLLGQARLHLANGKISEALDKSRQHVALHPAAGDGRACYAAALMRAGGAGEAVDILRPVAERADAPVAVASLFGRALTAVGELEEAGEAHGRALAAAPDDAAAAAAWIADAFWLEPAPDRLKATMESWIARFGRPAKSQHLRRPEGKLTIAYLVSALADRRDAAAVAAVARAHDRARVLVLGYGIGAQSWEENVAYLGAFDKWRDVAALDPATLARFFSGDGVHVVVDAGGIAAPTQLQALARTSTALRIGWLANPGAIAAPIYDAQITAQGLAGDSDSPRWGAHCGYPILREGEGGAVREMRSECVFGADVAMSQLDAATVELWSSVLAGAPGAVLLLRTNDMGPGSNIDRLIARFGRNLAARIDIVAADRPEQFYAQVDVVLAPCCTLSPRMAAEAVAAGVPVVTLAGEGGVSPYAGVLRDLGLAPMLVAADAADYLGVALSFAGSREARAQARAAVIAAVAAAPAGADAFAKTIEERAMAALAESSPT